MRLKIQFIMFVEFSHITIDFAGSVDEHSLHAQVVNSELHLHGVFHLC